MLLEQDVLNNVYTQNKAWDVLMGCDLGYIVPTYVPSSGQHVFCSFFPLLKAIHTVAIEPRAIIVFSCTIDPVIRPLGLQAVI